MCVIFRLISLASSKRNRNYVAEKGFNPPNPSCTHHTHANAQTHTNPTETHTHIYIQCDRYQFSNVLLILVALNFKTNNSFFSNFHAADITAIIADLHVVK